MDIQDIDPEFELEELEPSDYEEQIEALVTAVVSLRVDENGEFTDDPNGHTLEQLDDLKERLDVNGGAVATDVWDWMRDGNVEEMRAMTADEVLSLFLNDPRIRDNIKRDIKSIRISLISEAIGAVSQDTKEKVELMRQDRVDTNGNLVPLYYDVLYGTQVGRLVLEARFLEARAMLRDNRREVVEDVLRVVGDRLLLVRRANEVAGGLIGLLPRQELGIREEILERFTEYQVRRTERGLLERRLIAQYGNSLLGTLPGELLDGSYWSGTHNLAWLRTAIVKWSILTGVTINDIASEGDFTTGYLARFLCYTLSASFQRMRIPGNLYDVNDGEYLLAMVNWFTERVELDVRIGLVSSNRSTWAPYLDLLRQSPELPALLAQLTERARISLAIRAIKITVGVYATREPELQPVANVLLHPTRYPRLLPLTERWTKLLVGTIFISSTWNLLVDGPNLPLWAVESGTILEATRDRATLHSLLLSFLRVIQNGR